jgi:hypothetical protein
MTAHRYTNKDEGAKASFVKLQQQLLEDDELPYARDEEQDDTADGQHEMEVALFRGNSDKPRHPVSAKPA